MVLRPGIRTSTLLFVFVKTRPYDFPWHLFASIGSLSAVALLIAACFATDQRRRIHSRFFAICYLPFVMRFTGHQTFFQCAKEAAKDSLCRAKIAKSLPMATKAKPRPR